MGKRPLFWTFLLVSFFVLLCGRAGWLTSPSPPFEEEDTVSLLGTVEELDEKGNSRQIRLSNIFLSSGISYQGQVLVQENHGIELKIGNKVRVKGVYRKLQEASNPGQFDQKAYYEALGIGMILQKAEVSVVKKDTAVFRQGIFELKKRLLESIKSIAGEEEAALFSAMLLGEKGELGEEQKELYKSGGISHILAISGLHISLVGMLLYRMLRRFRRSYMMSTAISGSFMVAYGYLVGFGVSAKRAILMFLVYLGAELMGESYDLISSWSLAGLLILISQPRMLFQCSFQLSFLSVGALGLVYPSLGKMVIRKGKIADSLLVSLSVTFATLPCMLYWFFEYMPCGMLLNLVVIPLVPVVFLSGAAGMIGGCWTAAIGVFLAGPGVLVLKFFDELLQAAERLPADRMTVGRPALWKIAVYYVLILAAAFWPEKERPRKKAADRGLRLFLLGAALCILTVRAGKTAQVAFLDVGQGDGIYLRTPEGTNCLIDGGSSTVSKVGTYRIVPFLKSQGVGTLDYLFLTHMDEDHVNGTRELLEDQSHGVRVRCLCLADIPGDETREELERTAEQFGTEILWISRGTRFCEKNFSLDCLYPLKGGNGDDKNENSMVLVGEFFGRKILFTGDLEGKGEEETVRLGGLSKVDILKVGHHGSKGATSERFLGYVSPRIAVISAGEGNSYGHPAPEVLERLKKEGTRIYETQTGGAIIVEIDKQEMRVREYRR